MHPQAQRIFSCSKRQQQQTRQQPANRSYLNKGCKHSHQTCRCQATGTDTDTKTAKQDQVTRKEETPAEAAARSPFNTGSMDITTAGATSSLCGHPLAAEKTIVIVRHGMTTWNEEQRIQASVPTSLSDVHTSPAYYLWWCQHVSPIFKQSKQF